MRDTRCTTAGIGLKSAQLAALLADSEPVGFVEVHAENYLGMGGAPLAGLECVRERFPLSVHGVGLSIGGENPLDEIHLDRLARLLTRFEPAWFSEHLAWSSHGGVFFNDLLPLPYHAGTLRRVCVHVDRVQERLGRRMLLENPATYLEFADSTMTEGEFVSEVVRRTGCGLLLDVNNLYVSAINHSRDPRACLDAMPLAAVGEIHLAGHAVDTDANGDVLLIDHHGVAVADPVWALYAEALARIGPVATLIEWDNDVPGYDVLRNEARRADAVLACVTTREVAA
jgi:hypothetical protein